MTATTDLLAPFAAAPRIALRAELEPLIGSTIQPTGFPNIGPATFERPGAPNPASLLVESVQSLANHLEAIGWDEPGQRPVEAIAKLPYLAVQDAEGAFLTSSRLEPHRLAGAYVREATINGTTGLEWTATRLGLVKGRPLPWPQIYGTIFELDPLCLLHGVFFSDKPYHGNPKVRRAITLVIEAHDVREADSGGVKRDDVQFDADEGAGRTAKEGYGFIPFGRTEFTAGEIVLSAAIDAEQIRGYGLPARETELLLMLALWEVRSLLDRPMRLRTRCDLVCGTVTVTRPGEAQLPSLPELEAALSEAIGAASFETPGPRTLTWVAKSRRG